jgi:hypothetical protein
MIRRRHIDENPNDLPSLSIRRPVLVLVLNLLVLLAGVAAILAVETRELPDVDRPIVSVRAEYPGASPETMDAEVISVIEGAVARVSGIQNIRSASEENAGRMRIEFRPGMDLDSAASDVREAVNRITRELPDRLERVIVVKADDDSEAIVNIAVRSDVLIEEELTRIVDKDIIPELISIEGVADVRPFGNRKRMLRVVVDPLRLTSYGLSVSDVATTLRLVPFDVPAGSFRSEDQELIVRADASVVSASQISDIIIRDSIRIGDIANVYFGPEDAQSYTRLNGQSVIGLGVIRQAKANTVQISDGVHAAVDRINARVNNLELVITDDQAVFIRSSIGEVLITLSITIAIVIATIWVFMGSLRATLVPSVAIPVALVGTVAAIWLAGFSINILTLLALVLATGLVVDDAIVVLENIQRRRAQGLGARAAAVLGTRQVFSRSLRRRRCSYPCLCRSRSCPVPRGDCSASSAWCWRLPSPSRVSCRCRWCRRRHRGCRRRVMAAASTGRRRRSVTAFAISTQARCRSCWIGPGFRYWSRWSSPAAPPCSTSNSIACSSRPRTAASSTWMLRARTVPVSATGTDKRKRSRTSCGRSSTAAKPPRCSRSWVPGTRTVAA